MRTLLYSFRQSIAIAMALLLFGCNVYRTTPVTVEDAIDSQKYVKVVMNNHDYEFRRLEKMEERLLGVTKRRSATTRKFKQEPLIKDEKIWKYELEEESIESVYLRDEFETGMVKVGIPVLLFGSLTYAFLEGAGELGGNGWW